MSGELPSALQNCMHLVILDLSENHFTGSVPTWMGDKLSDLVNLDLAHNNFSGAIPKCFSNLSAMATKYQGFGYLGNWYFGFGEIPEELGTLIGLISLNLPGNLLTGNIPDSIGNMELIESLDLSMN
ncbi:hypothetical protein V6N12_034853 [Hibiscus sabdariffa]|uniref:Uncharacterized protein n=1 Tax=Hibiscus sabdariffa TaxID=183260 RepID=A0ABR2BQH2_9ROSI